VAERYDLIAVTRIQDADQLDKLVTYEIGAIEGVLDTTTLFAVRQCSEQNMERVFSLGMAYNASRFRSPSVMVGRLILSIIESAQH